jgi:hypothetical protein
LTKEGKGVLMMALKEGDCAAVSFKKEKFRFYPIIFSH